MSELSTTYMGLQLQNPIIIASSQLTATPKKIEAAVRSGAGAIVLKSIFEENVRRATRELTANTASPSSLDVHDLLDGLGESYVLDDYLGLVEEAKRLGSIPIIASLNCRSVKAWVDYARKLENVGADGLELNIFELAAETKTGGREVEKRTVEIVHKVASAVSISVSAKLGPHYSSLGELAEELRSAGAKAIVLFNRFHRPDIDIERVRYSPAPIFSSETEGTLPLRWIALLSGRINIDFAASTGIHDAAGVIRQLLAGARSVQLCTTLYLHGVEHIGTVLAELSAWMKHHKYASVADFRGLLCSERTKGARQVDQTQYNELLARG